MASLGSDQVCEAQNLVQAFLFSDFFLKLHVGFRTLEELEILSQFVEDGGVNLQEEVFVEVVLDVLVLHVEEVLHVVVQLHWEVLLCVLVLVFVRS